VEHSSYRSSTTGAAHRALAGLRRIDPRQAVKAVVYSLLFVNFLHYAVDDFTIARHTWHAGWSFFDWTSAFATTLDEAAWFLLLFLLELETYLLSDEAFTRRRVLLMHGLRFLCYLAIGHTVVAFGAYLLELREATEYVGGSLCRFADQGLSFARNLQYTQLNASNCASLSPDSHFFRFSGGQAITDARGMRVEVELAWLDLIEVCVWLAIIALIEVMVRLQDRGVSGGRALRAARLINAGLYGVLWLAAAYWAYRGHWLFAWDEALWILGFMAIGMNLSQWRDEIKATQGPSASVPPFPEGT